MNAISTLPVSTAECERELSLMNLIFSPLRSKLLVEEHLLSDVDFTCSSTVGSVELYSLRKGLVGKWTQGCQFHCGTCTQTTGQIKLVLYVPMEIYDYEFVIYNVCVSSRHFFMQPRQATLFSTS